MYPSHANMLKAGVSNSHHLEDCLKIMTLVQGPHPRNRTQSTKHEQLTLLEFVPFKTEALAERLTV